MVVLLRDSLGFDRMIELGWKVGEECDRILGKTGERLVLSVNPGSGARGSMPEFDAEEWLEVAEICCERIEGVGQEALLRTALNRACYAALLSVKRRIERVHGRGSVSGFRTHAAIRRAGNQAGVDSLEVLKGLCALRALREAAHYELRSDPLTWSTVHAEVGRSRALIRQRIRALPDAEFRRLRLR